MKINRVGRVVAVGLMVVLLAGAAGAQEPGRGPGGRIIDVYRAALAKLGLSDDQKAKIKAIFASATQDLQALAEQRREDLAALKAALDAATPDPTAVGTAFLKARTDRQALKTEGEKIHAAVVAVLTPEQKAKLDAFLDVLKAMRRRGAGRST